MIDVSEYEGAAGDVDDDGAGPIFVTHRTTGEEVIAGTMVLRDRVLEFSDLVVDETLSREDVIALIVIVYLFDFTVDYYRTRADRISLAWADGSKTVTFNYPAAN